MRRRHSRKNQRAIVLGVAISCLCVMSVGYAAFNTKLTLNATGNLKKHDAITAADLKSVVKTESGDNAVAEDGLYQDPVEPNRYVYRGKNPSNYITFNDETAKWRIVSIESDGTMKIMKNDPIEKKAFDVASTRNTGYCASAGETGCNAWAISSAYTSANGSYTGAVSADSDLKTYLNDTYYNTLGDDKEYIVAHEFYYGSAAWESEDISVQIADEKKATAESNIGLIQASDFIKSNANKEKCATKKLTNENFEECKDTTWMIKNAAYWTLTANGDSATGVACIGTDGNFASNNAVSSEIDVIPVFYLKSDTKLSGTGTQAKPYTITKQ